MYGALVGLHVLLAVLGFGYIAVSGVYAGTARHPERAGSLDEASRFFASRTWADWVLVALPAPGLAAVLVEGDASQAWVAVAFVLWIVAVGLVHGVARPARAAVKAGLGDAAAVAVPARRLARAAAAADVIFVIALLDMVFKPGH